MQRKCRYVPLSAHPLVLALCQVRLSPVPQMERYIPAIHEVFRRQGFPIERAGKVHQVTFGPSGSAPVQVTPYSADADHQFRHADHRFRSMPITLERSGGP